uniref:Uncharacterized protein n=1 Tax=viral metagenome TaxID=1070528 RepID=A0A6C0HMR8_9ZZZZ
MPRNRNLNDNDEKTKLSPSNALDEDYLDVDKPLPGQNFYCISFVSPDKVLNCKEMWYYHHYQRKNVTTLQSLFTGKLDSIIAKCEDGTVDISAIISLKKSLDEACAKEICTFDEFKEKFVDFTFADEEKLNESFDKLNDFQTSVRGVKVRGVFDSKREADVRASVLQRQDPSFDVFVGQVGFWCPWNPNPQKIADIEYLNNDLNRLVKEYKANEVKKDMFYNEQKVNRQKDSHTLSAEDRLKHKEGLNKTMGEKEYMEQKISESGGIVMPSTNNPVGIINQDDVGNVQDMQDMIASIDTAAGLDNVITGLDVGSAESRAVSFETTSSVLMADDPWVQRKLQGQL